MFVHLYNICTTSAQRLRRWSNIVQMLYKRFVFAGMARSIATHIRPRPPPPTPGVLLYPGCNIVQQVREWHKVLTICLPACLPDFFYFLFDLFQ